MDQLFESGLFMELGEVVGHDPVLYEDITKQHDFNTTSSINLYQEGMEGQYPTENGFDHAAGLGYGELDSLLAEGNHLLEQLMAANGLGLSHEATVDLADVDEITEKTIEPTIGYNLEQHDLLADLEAFVAPEYADVLSPKYADVLSPEYADVLSPASSIATLPSEPSSPVDLFSFEQADYIKPDYIKPDTETDLADILQSLIDDDQHGEINNAVSSYYDESIESPASDDSYYESYVSLRSPDESFITNSSLETYGEPLGDASPTKAKAKKSKSTPYSKLPANRKERKKRQNKEAAIRYREKKRSEAQVIVSEETELSDKNKQLKTEVLNLEREILCMKELLSDVFNIHSL